MMLSHILFFTAVGVIGIYCQKVTKLSVKSEDIISIPCLYDSQYANNVKYLCLCKTRFYKPCHKVVKTDEPSGSEKYSIVDDKLKHVFTVTIRNLTATDTCYLCGVSRFWFDLQYEVSLDVTTGVPNLYVAQQNVSCVLGGSVTILCHYVNLMGFQWCKVGSRCISKQYEEMNGMRVSINTSLPNVANVTMSGLETNNSGWYFCENGGFQMPVYITISKDFTSASPTRTPQFTSANRWSTDEPHTSQFTSCPNTGLPITSSQAVTEHLHTQPKIKELIFNSTEVIVISVVTTLLLFIVVAAGVAWKMKRCRETIPETLGDATGSQTAKDPEEVLYSDIILTQPENKKKNQVSKEIVIYSTIVAQDGSQQMAGPADGSVIYSTVSK